MPKPFLTYAQQLAKLRDEKHLVIRDENRTISSLKRIGYYSLISGYKFLFRIPMQKNYKASVTFEEVEALYKYDEALRELFLHHLLHIERHIRSLLSYYFTEKNGEQQSAYLEKQNYNYVKKHAIGIERLVGELEKLTKTSQYPYIAYQRNTYCNVPLWVLVNALTFGTLSKMYFYFPSDLQSKVSKNFPNVNEKQLGQFLSVLTKFRNVCAHNERLFFFQCRDSIPNTRIHQKLGIPQKNATYQYGKNDLFSVVIAFRYLLPNDEFLVFKKNLSVLISKLLDSTEHISENELLTAMGFPTNWKNITRYKL